jgi:uncharacterized protein YcbK (DUF882 family)
MLFQSDRSDTRQQNKKLTADNKPSGISRRQFLQAGLGITGALFLPPAFARQDTHAVSRNEILQAERRLSLYNLHTGEQLKATYWVEGEYQPGELKAIDHILRDYRTDEVIEVDNALLDLLNVLHRNMDSNKPFQVISGYRSPQTNAALRKQSSGVAKKSFHMSGKAIDIRLPGSELADLRKAALELQAGGVGYYPKSDFIHVDTGPVRHWG